MKKIAPFILRLGLGAVIIWFGFQQLSNALPWVKLLPDWTNSIPLSQITIIHLNGWFEVTFGILLISGFYTRFVALLLALHLFEIAYTVGYGGIGVRDFGLAMATLSIFFAGQDDISLDKYFSKQKVFEQKV